MSNLNLSNFFSNNKIELETEIKSKAVNEAVMSIYLFSKLSPKCSKKASKYLFNKNGGDTNHVNLVTKEYSDKFWDGVELNSPSLSSSSSSFKNNNNNNTNYSDKIELHNIFNFNNILKDINTNYNQEAFKNLKTFNQFLKNKKKEDITLDTISTFFNHLQSKSLLNNCLSTYDQIENQSLRQFIFSKNESLFKTFQKIENSDQRLEFIRKFENKINVDQSLKELAAIILLSIDSSNGKNIGNEIETFQSTDVFKNTFSIKEINEDKIQRLSNLLQNNSNLLKSYELFEQRNKTPDLSAGLQGKIVQIKKEINNIKQLKCSSNKIDDNNIELFRNSYECNSKILKELSEAIN